MKAQVDESLGKTPEDAVPKDPLASGDASQIEQNLVSKIKNKDSLIKEIDAQIKRLDKLEGGDGGKGEV